MTAAYSNVDWQTLTRRAAALLREGQAREALLLMQQAERKAPKARDVRYWLANACRMNGQAQRALDLFRGLLAERPDDVEASFGLAFLLRDAGQPADAARVLTQAARQDRITVDQLLQITGFLRDISQFDAAIETCEKAVALRPDQADLHFKLARLHQGAGHFDRAREELLATLDLDPATGPAWTVLAQQHEFHEDDELLQRIEAAAENPLGGEADMCIAFAHGKALDDLGRWPEAWPRYREGNRRMAAARPWDKAAWHSLVERSTERAASCAPAGHGDGRHAVFIVGMPRSGTTLLEQMLDRHPVISGRGETHFLPWFAQQQTDGTKLPDAQRRQMADAFWQQLRQNGPPRNRYVDKNPLNFRYLDRLFDLLPDARVLHLSRDGRASCLSCYFQLFEHEEMAFSYRLEDLVSVYDGYSRLISAWEQACPDRILRVDYADLVSDRRPTLQAVLEFLGLDWDDAVLDDSAQSGLVRTASVWQARQAVHSRSLERWRHYYDQAPEFFDSLEAIDKRYRFRG